MLPFVDLRTQYRLIADQVHARINAVLEHGQFIMGPDVTELEYRLAAFVGTQYCVSCSSGTDALLMGLMAKDVRRGDIVLTTPFTFIASADVIALLGAIPVFVDVNPVTFNIDPDGISKTLHALESRDRSYPLPQLPAAQLDASRIKAIIPVDLFGLPCDYARINSIANEHGLFVVEDAAQGFGSKYQGRRACALAEIGCTSFFPAKPLGCYGDGGAIFTNDAEFEAKLVSIRVHGQGRDRYENVRLGMTGRLDTIQAAVLLSKLDIFERELAERQRVAANYTRHLAKLSDLTVPSVPDGYMSAWAQYSVVAKDGRQRALILEKLRNAGIPTAIYYPKSLHQQQAFSYLGYRQGDFPVCEDLSRRIFSLPMHPYLAEDTIEKIASSIAQAVDHS